MKNITVREATQEWINGFDNVPGSVIEKMAKADASIAYYDSYTFRLIASPRIECSICSGSYEGDLALDELREAATSGKSVPCDYCEYNDGGEWIMGYPQYAFPCGWGTLFAPSDSSDIRWFLENKEDVAKLGFYVFESDDYGVLLGIDAGGFDFLDAFWIPLYRLRGLQWHSLCR